ncbi:MAG: SDR family NAD(P)-dependent oxidoreductase, partial [Elusimicrobia bacterium]|nr:SDR family NAD(P)-dependent oxidoreductase [Elusimicrobiota bacterium]
MELKGKVALVTGGAKRVGRAIALALAGRGAHVAITYQRSKVEATQTVQDLERTGGKACAVAGEVSQAGDVERMVSEVLRTFGHIDVLVNNAAVFFKTPFDTVTDQDWDRTIDTNLKGT